MSLTDFLISALSGTFALGPIVYWLFEHGRMHERVSLQWRPFVVGIGTFLLLLGFWGVALFLGIVPMPPTRLDVANEIWRLGTIAFSGFSSSTVLHGFLQLRKQRVTVNSYKGSNPTSESTPPYDGPVETWPDHPDWLEPSQSP